MPFYWLKYSIFKDQRTNMVWEVLVNYILKLSIFPLFLCFFFFECPTSYYAGQIYYKSRIIFMRIRFPLK